jgi:hypothetical protein
MELSQIFVEGLGNMTNTTANETEEPDNDVLNTSLRKNIQIPDSHDWSSDSELLCEKIRVNCAILAKYHKKCYTRFKDNQKLFKVPVIVLGSINTVLSISLEKWTRWASAVICGINLILTIISSIEMFLGIQKNVEVNYILQREFYILSIEIFKTLQQARVNRSMKGNEYLNKVFTDYNKLIELSTVNRHIEDKLLPLNESDNTSIKLSQDGSSV